jgi:segregation and condensation protein A
VTYEVSTEVFDGPFDLLLHLILREELDIHEVSLSRIVGAYLEHVASFDQTDLEVATEFLLIAATLVEMKARRLVPSRDVHDLDEELALWEERDLLLSRLLDAKTFKDVASVFGRLIESASLAAPRRTGPDERFAALVPDLLDGVSPARLQRAYLRALRTRVPTVLDLRHVTPVTVSVADAVLDLLQVLPSLGETNFRAITDDCVERIEVVVRFLAILELFKQGRVDLEQADRFGDIVIRWVEDPDLAPDVALAVDDYEG